MEFLGPPTAYFRIIKKEEDPPPPPICRCQIRIFNQTPHIFNAIKVSEMTQEKHTLCFVWIKKSRWTLDPRKWDFLWNKYYFNNLSFNILQLNKMSTLLLPRKQLVFVLGFSFFRKLLKCTCTVLFCSKNPMNI